MNTYFFICLIKYPAMAKITAITTVTATMSPIATADNLSSRIKADFVVETDEKNVVSVDVVSVLVQSKTDTSKFTQLNPYIKKIIKI